ncbi:MAG: PEGA domain-containing protein [Myxococcales bacterium]|nr:PEGA domain-containing protein [Myxococcales bacterium]
MTGSDPETHDDDPMLPERHVLEAWEVPMTSPELTDRIMSRLDELPARPTISSPMSATASSWSAGGLGWVVVAVGMVAAAALVLTLVRPGASEAPGEGSPPAAVTQAPLATEARPSVAVPSLVVRTEPADAQVRIDGIPVVGPSPFTIAGLSDGAHRLEVAREGYLPVERTVEGGVGMELPVELPRRDVVLAIIVDPPEASVRLWSGDEHGVEIGHDGDRYALRRSAGVSYEVEASAPGYLPRRIPLALSGAADQEVRLSLVLDPEAAEADRPARSGGSSRRDRSPMPELKNPFRSRRDEGPSSPELLDPFSSKDDRSKVEPARLNIGTASGDPPARVSIDGVAKGMTPLVALKVAPGRHRVEFEFSDGHVETVTVEVKAGERKVVRNRE